MRSATIPRARAGLPPLAPYVPLLEATDLPDDDWSLPTLGNDESPLDDDRYATLNVACSFDD